MRLLRRVYNFPFFPILIGAYPALSMLGVNAGETSLGAVTRPLIFSVIFTAVAWGAAGLFLRNVKKAALLSVLLTVLFFSYGHVYHLLAGQEVLGFSIGRHRNLAALYAAVLLLGSLRIWRMKLVPARFVCILNLVSIFMAAMPLAQTGDYLIREARSNQRAPEAAGAADLAESAGERPDIYYIILDMYARDDVLLDQFGYDNSTFLAALEKMGFYIGRCSQSNYEQTQLSLASSLNMDYLQNLISLSPGSTDRTMLDNLIEDNAVRKYLEKLGYRTVSLSAYQPLQIESADVFISTAPKDLPVTAETPVVTAFEALFIKSTGAVFLMELPWVKSLDFVKDINYPYASHIRQQLYILDRMESIPNIPGPKFVFVHIQIPHPPYVFGPEGELEPDPPPFPADPSRPISAERLTRVYTNQVRFVNKRIVPILEKILENPGQRPIIVIQGDHGHAGMNQMAILNAYYLPRGQADRLYPQISPVNTFRFILDQNFDARLGLVQDLSYASRYSDPYNFEPAADTRPGCIPEQ